MTLCHYIPIHKVKLLLLISNSKALFISKKRTSTLHFRCFFNKPYVFSTLFPLSQPQQLPCGLQKPTHQPFPKALRRHGKAWFGKKGVILQAESSLKTAIIRSVAGETRSRRRKVRATQDNLLLKQKLSARVNKLQKKTTALRKESKGEKAG